MNIFNESFFIFIFYFNAKSFFCHFSKKKKNEWMFILKYSINQIHCRAHSSSCYHAQPFFFFEQGLTNLIILSLDGNPLAEQLDSYRTYVVFHLPTLKALDGIAVVRTRARTRFQTLQTLLRWSPLGFCFRSYSGGEWVWKCKGYVWGEIKPRHGCGEAGPHRLRWHQLPHPGVLLYSVMGSRWQ